MVLKKTSLSLNLLLLQRIVLIQIFFSSFSVFAKSGITFERQFERDSERWTLTTNFTSGKNKNTGLLLRLFNDGKSSKSGPRLEPYLYGFWYKGLQNDGTAWEATGYGGFLYFNNFISGIFSITTPNIVLGIIGESRDERKKSNGMITSYGPSLRLFGLNQQDTALYLNFKHTQRLLQGVAYQEWNWEAAAVIYLAHNLRVEGSWLFSNSDWRASPSNFAEQKGFKIGGGIEIGILRIDGFYERTMYTIKDPTALADASKAQPFDEARQVIKIGISL